MLAQQEQLKHTEESFVSKEKIFFFCLKTKESSVWTRYSNNVSFIMTNILSLSLFIFFLDQIQGVKEAICFRCLACNLQR